MNIGIVGLGHLGKIHLKLLSEIPDFNVTAIYDLNEDTHRRTGINYTKQKPVCNSYDELLQSLRCGKYCYTYSLSL